MDAGATSWLMLGSLIRIPLLAEATNVRVIVAVSILFRRRRVLGGHPDNLCMSASRDDGVSALKGGCSCGGVASFERSAPAVAAPLKVLVHAFAWVSLMIFPTLSNSVGTASPRRRGLSVSSI